MLEACFRSLVPTASSAPELDEGQDVLHRGGHKLDGFGQILELLLHILAQRYYLSTARAQNGGRSATPPKKKKKKKKRKEGSDE